MTTPLKQREAAPLRQIATAFVQTMIFDLDFNYIRGSVEQATIVPDAPVNWESESCHLTPYIWYEYTRVSKTNPQLSRSGLAQINQARKKLRLFASLAKTKEAVLRIVKEPIVIKLHPNIEAAGEIHIYYLEESIASLMADTLAMERTTRDMPDRLKKIEKELSKKNAPKPKKRRPKQR